MQNIKEAESGILYVFIADEETYEKLDVYRPDGDTSFIYQANISLGASRQEVRNACAGIPDAVRAQ